MCGFRHFLCQVELGSFISVLHWAGLRYHSSVLFWGFLCWPSVGLWFHCGCCWFMVGLGWSLNGHRVASTFPLLFGATPKLWLWKCLWGAQISSASTGVLCAGLFGSRHRHKEGSVKSELMHLQPHFMDLSFCTEAKQDFNSCNLLSFQTFFSLTWQNW